MTDRSFDLSGVPFMGSSEDDPVDWMPDCAVAMVKYIDGSGNVIFQSMSAGQPNIAEHVGMIQLLTVAMNLHVESHYEATSED